MDGHILRSAYKHRAEIKLKDSKELYVIEFEIKLLYDLLINANVSYYVRDWDLRGRLWAQYQRERRVKMMVNIGEETELREIFSWLE